MINKAKKIKVLQERVAKLEGQIKTTKFFWPHGSLSPRVLTAIEYCKELDLKIKALSNHFGLEIRRQPERTIEESFQVRRMPGVSEELVKKKK